MRIGLTTKALAQHDLEDVAGANVLHTLLDGGLEFLFGLGLGFGGLLGIDLNVYNLSGHNVVFGEIPGDIAQILEARGDDGVPSTGSIQSHGSQTTYAIDTRYDVGFR